MHSILILVSLHLKAAKEEEFLSSFSFVGMAEVLGCGTEIFQFDTLRRQFVEKLSKELGVRGVVAGENYHFGYRASGDASDLQKLRRVCPEQGRHEICVRVVRSQPSSCFDDGRPRKTKLLPLRLVNCSQNVTVLYGPEGEVGFPSLSRTVSLRVSCVFSVYKLCFVCGLIGYIRSCTLKDDLNLLNAKGSCLLGLVYVHFDKFGLKVLCCLEQLLPLLEIMLGEVFSVKNGSPNGIPWMVTWKGSISVNSRQNLVSCCYGNLKGAGNLHQQQDILSIATGIDSGLFLVMFIQMLDELVVDINV
ncbi:hypothetical protein HAX54_028872 [Datura stramonium]|uniref:FAD synthase n=1 Tax=Datura stramonium TaxID=4076 RepID=A0ABS8V7R2_DATST|nr:hypothetical protein [Datura stramonium]